MEKTNKLEEMEKFFKSDINIKKILLNVAPKEINAYDKDACITYGTKLFDALKDLEYEFSDVTIGLSVNKYANSILKKCYDELIKSNYSFERMKSIYQRYLSNMDEKLIDDVREELCGYSFCSPIKLYEQSKSINELLHVAHSYITNNEEYLQAIPTLEEKVNTQDYPITLRGEENELAKHIFDEIPEDMDVGYTDIVSLSKNNKILMMVRDRGHALSIEIDEEKDNNDVWVKYFIPKICNLEMVNNLRGVNKVTKEDKTTIGGFRSNKDNIVQELIDFIGKVPTDSDMVLDPIDSTFDIDNFNKELQNEEDYTRIKRIEINDLKELAETRKISKIKALVEKVNKKFLNKESGDVRDSEER